MTETAAIEPITVSVAEARRLSGLGTTKLYELMAAGTLTKRKVGAKTLVTYASLKALLTAVPEAQP